MELITIILFFLVISSGSIFSSIYFDKKYEDVLPITCTSIIFISFILGMIGLLKISTYVVIFLSIVLYVLSIYKMIKQKSVIKMLKNIVTPGFCIYVFFCLLFFITIKGKMFDAWDEFSHWGDIVKVMTTINDFGTNPSSYSIYNSYPPAMALFQYTIMKMNYFVTSNSFVEWLSYYAYYILAISYILPVTNRIKYKNVLSIITYVLCIILVPFTFYYGVYYQLYIDPFLSFLICAGALQLLWNSDKGMIYDLNLICISFTLVLAKDAGLAFAIFIAISQVISHIFNGNNKPFNMKNICWYIMSICSVFIPKLLWNIDMKINNVEESFNNKIDFVNLLNVILGRDDSYRRTVLKNYVTQLLTGGIQIGNTGISISYFVLLVISIVFIISIARKATENGINKKSSLNSSINIIVTSLVFIVGTCVVYMYKFSEYEALGLASFDRYIAIVFLAMWLYISVSIAINANNNKTLCEVLICLMFLSAPLEIVIPYLARSTVKSSIALRDTYKEIIEESNKYVSNDDTVWLISEESTGFERLVYKYSIRPAKIYGYSSIGKPFYDGDIWTYEMTAEEWKESLSTFCDYVALYHINDYFVENYSEVFTNPSEIYEGCIYRVNNDGTLTLCK